MAPLPSKGLRPRDFLDQTDILDRPLLKADNSRMTRATASIAAAASLLVLAACADFPSSCSGSFDGELTPDAVGAPSKVAAAEQWADATGSPTLEWVETATGATSGDWILTVVKTERGGWGVVSQRCS